MMRAARSPNRSQRGSTVAVILVMLCGANLASACSESPDGIGPDGGTPRDGGRDGAMNEGGTPPDGGGDDDPEIALFDDENDERVTDILCTSAAECLVSTDSNTGPGHVYTTDGNTITGTVLTGDPDFTAKFMQLGDVGFLGFDRFGDRLVVRLDNGSSGFVTATSDYGETASYSIGPVGTPNDRGSFGTSDQRAFAFDGTTWTMLVTGSLFTSSATLPGMGAAFTNVWAPQLITPVPANIAALRQGDATICNADPAISFSPARLQVAHVSSDASLIVTASGAPNQSGFHGAGVCIRRANDPYFHYAAFPGVTKGNGPMGITCNTADHCVAVGGVRNVSPASVFVTSNASAGSASTWVRATTPTFSSSVELVYTAFAPDGLHGFIAGRDGGAYLLATTDGGATWTNATSMVSSFTDAPLHVVYAPDATHVFVGGEDDTLLAFGY